MKKCIAGFFAVAILSACSFAAAPATRVKMETSNGTMIIALDSTAAPKTVANFLSYVNKGFYDGTIFHRVIQKFMIQGGGFTANMAEKPTTPPIQNEANNGLKNTRGTIAMARTPDPNSASAQFFINTVDNVMLNYRNSTQEGWGYCVFGRVVSGMNVVDSIAAVQTTSRNGMDDVPVSPVVIKKAFVMKDTVKAK
jgi:cyclophilin family peptidyl-prolyl cis-trans isomerase